jgi:hypothetical protein
MSISETTSSQELGNSTTRHFRDPTSRSHGHIPLRLRALAFPPRPLDSIIHIVSSCFILGIQIPFTPQKCLDSQPSLAPPSRCNSRHVRSRRAPSSGEAPVEKVRIMGMLEIRRTPRSVSGSSKDNTRRRRCLIRCCLLLPRLTFCVNLVRGSRRYISSRSQLRRHLASGFSIPDSRMAQHCYRDSTRRRHLQHLPCAPTRRNVPLFGPVIHHLDRRASACLLACAGADYARGQDLDGT